MLQIHQCRPRSKHIFDRIHRSVRSAAAPFRFGADFDPHRYTSGRWLRLDKEQRKARYIDFDFRKLCDKVLSCSSGASKIVKCIKIEGGFNRVFLVDLDNGESLVARLPFSVAGPPRLTTSSEVATMEYIRRNTSIPTPTVLDWSDDPSNHIGTEYIIMEQVPGVNLDYRWDSMNPEQRMLVVKSLARMCQQMMALQFPAYGSIYFAGPDVCESNTVPLSDGLCIGPHCGTRYWETTPGHERWYERKPPNRGPWKGHESYLCALTDAGLSRIPLSKRDMPKAHLEVIEEHVHLNETAQETLLALTASPLFDNVRRPTIMHRDLHKRNIFVSDEDPTQITCLIDWQSSSVEPAYLYGDTVPDLCDYPSDWDESQVSDPPTNEQQKIITSVGICQKTWAVMLYGFVPVLAEAQRLDQQNLLRLLQYVPSAWSHGAVAIRQDLIKLSELWTTEYSLPGSCPYQPTTQEIERHSKLLPKWDETYEVREVLYKGLQTDSVGWIPIERWEAMQWLHKELFDEWIGSAAATVDFTEEEARAAWPFDEPIDD